jgi:phospholipid/cholesterol/gamma-HCH transport system substrate-binding protein
VKGDYTNLYADLDLNLGDVVSNLGRSRQSLLPSIPGLTGGAGNGVPLPLPTLPGGSGGNTGGLGGLLGGLLGGGGH